MDKKEKFEFTYSAPTAEERREIDGIRSQYLPAREEEGAFARLRSLDRRVRRLPPLIGLTLGIVGCLIFGTGLTLVLEWGQPLWGVAVAVIGAAAAACAYPSKKLTHRRLKKVYGDEILRLCDELLHDQLKQ